MTITPGRTFRNTTTDAGVSGELNYKFGGATSTSITACSCPSRAAPATSVPPTSTSPTAPTTATPTAGSRPSPRSSASARRSTATSTGWSAAITPTRSCRFPTTSSSAPSPAPSPPAASSPPSTPPRCCGLRLPGLPLGGRPRDADRRVRRRRAAAHPAIDRLSTINDVGSVHGHLYNQDSENWAVFTHNIFKITDKLSLTVGARYTHEKKNVRTPTSTTTTPSARPSRRHWPLLANPALAALAGGIVTLRSCTGN